MKQPKMSDLAVDRRGARRIRGEMARARKVKITINVDYESLRALRRMAGKTGTFDSRLDRIEKELARLKKIVAA